jgi:hypothetical protein
MIQFFGPTNRIVESHCTNCGMVVSAATGIDSNAQPSPGDVTVCFECGHVMIFDDDLKVRDLTGDEIRMIAGDARIVGFQKLRARRKRR